MKIKCKAALIGKMEQVRFTVLSIIVVAARSKGIGNQSFLPNYTDITLYIKSKKWIYPTHTEGYNAVLFVTTGSLFHEKTLLLLEVVLNFFFVYFLLNCLTFVMIPLLLYKCACSIFLLVSYVSFYISLRKKIQN